MSLKDARMKAGEMRSLLDKGMNPKVEVRVQQQNTLMPAHLKKF